MSQGTNMAKFLGTLGNALIVGFALLVIVIFAFHGGTDAPVYLQWLFRYLHVLFGIMWIGLLYYFNFVQIPTMPSVPAELKPGVSKYIAPTALFWFRWAALLTVLMGLIVASHPPQSIGGYLIPALTFQGPLAMIGLGMWLGMIMAFNVWFVIWPNQKKALGLVEADADTKAKAATTAMMFSRINTILSIPMLYTMVTQQAGLVG
jgi:uncharacterized membrane protein